MADYINEVGDLYTEDEINQIAQENDTTIEDVISQNKLKPATSKLEKPGKPKPVAKKDAVATAKSTVSKSVKPSTVSQDDIWGKTKTQPEFAEKLQKVTQPKTTKPTLASIEERESGQVPPNQDKSWIPSIVDYKKSKVDEIEIPSHEST